MAQQSFKPIVLVTGCTKGGIGYGMCEEFRKHGCIVFATARRLEAMEGLAEVGCILLTLDVASQESCQSIVDQILAHPDSNGRIDILVNNAGLGGSMPLLDFDIDFAKQMFEANYFGLMRMCQIVGRHMGNRRSGTIVNMGSIMGNIPTPWSGIYSSTKHAVHAFTDALREEVRALNINVVLLAPGGIQSNIASRYDDPDPIKFPEGSFYPSALEGILRRARASQEAATPTNVFARRVVSRILKSKPPQYFSTGKRSTQWVILSWLPRWLTMRILGWNLLTHLVGRQTTSKKTT